MTAEMAFFYWNKKRFGYLLINVKSLVVNSTYSGSKNTF
jgi:hypothetical protein